MPRPRPVTSWSFSPVFALGLKKNSRFTETSVCATFSHFDQRWQAQEFDELAESKSEGTADFEDAQVGCAELLSALRDHERKQESLHVAFDKDGRVGEEKITVRQLHVPLKKIAVRLVLVVKNREVEDGGTLLRPRLGGPPEITDRPESPFIQYVR